MKYVYQSCPCGELKGIGYNSYSLFRGVRYADAKRWELPEEITHWEGTFDATFPNTFCSQYNAFFDEPLPTAKFYRDEAVAKTTIPYAENSLRLNIWTPVGAQNAPVLVHIHGGGYESGGGSESGEAYCKEGIVVVTINYRLNAFASAVGDGYTGNYGLFDQICALNWVKHNISAFGGDPSHITIMGHSAGAMSVQNLIFSPLAKGLFCGAIMLSGGGILPKAFSIRDSAKAEEIWQKTKEALGASSLDELKEIPAETLFRAWKSVCTSNPKYSCPATPVIDGISIPEAPRALTESGKINAVPTIMGFLSEDMWPHTLYRTLVEWGQLMSKGNHPPMYGFYFDRPAPGSDIGAYHGAELRYVFNTFGIFWRPFEAVDYRISDNIIAYFSSFIKTGIPTAKDLPEWKPVTCESSLLMHFGEAPCEMISVPEEKLEYNQKHLPAFPTA